MKKAIITGPTGAVGIALIRELIAQNVEVLAVCRVGSKRIGDIPKHEKVHILECDLADLTGLKTETEYDAFYHFGWDGTFGADARNDMSSQIRNIGYTIDAVHAAARCGCKKFIGAGSQAEYGRVDGLLTALTPTFPENGYGMAKLCAGEMSRVECEKLGLEHVWTRILSIYGPHDGSRTMIMSTIGKLLQGEIPALTAGEQMWDYLYAADVGRAMYLIGEKGIHGRIYPIGSGQMRPLKEYIEILRDSIDPSLRLGLGEIPYGKKQVMHLCADISELREDTGFEPAYSFERGIRETIDWCRMERNENN